MLAFLLLEDDEESEGDQIERQYWVQPCLAKREQFGVFHTIFQEIRNDPKRCRKYIRMNNNQFLYLVGLMSPDLQKQDTKMRDCVSVEELTCLVLRFLATGRTYRSLEFLKLLLKYQKLSRNHLVGILRRLNLKQNGSRFQKNLSKDGWESS